MTAETGKSTLKETRHPHCKENPVVVEVTNTTFARGMVKKIYNEYAMERGLGGRRWPRRSTDAP